MGLAQRPSNEMHMSIGAANRTYTFDGEELDRELYWAAGAIYRAVTAAGKDAAEYENYLIDNCDAIIRYASTRICR